jgi:DNA adenine methylase
VIKSPLRYPGGKSRAVELISNLIPEFSEYREPFLGGGSVFIRQNQLFPMRKFWINDSYFDLFNFWKMSQTQVQDLIGKVSALKTKYENGKELYYFLKSNSNNFNNLELASAFFIFNRITFSGTTLSGGYSESAFRGRFTTRQY